MENVDEIDGLLGAVRDVSTAMRCLNDGWECEATLLKSSNSDSADIVSMLPVELSLKILSFLSVFELCQSVSYVCSKWYHLSRDLSLWHTLDISDKRHIGVEQLVAIKHMLTKLRKLDVAGRNDFVNIDGLLELCPLVSSLKCFNLGFCEKINRPCLKVISLYCTKLEELNLEGSRNVGPRSLTALESLDLSSLNLSHCDRLEESDVVSLLECQPRLECLDIDGIPCVSLSVCQKVANLSETMRALHVDGISMEDECLKCLCCCVNLTELHISFCELLTDVGLWCLRSLDCLASFCLRKGFFFSAGGLIGLFEAWKFGQPLRMVYLNLTECSLVDDWTVIAIATIFINLQELHLAWCWEITDIGLLSVVQSMRELRHLNLCGLRKIIGLPLKDIPFNQRRLRMLDCTQCHSSLDPIPVDSRFVLQPDLHVQVDDSILHDVACTMPQLTVINYYNEAVDHSTKKDSTCVN